MTPSLAKVRVHVRWNGSVLHAAAASSTRLRPQVHYGFMSPWHHDRPFGQLLGWPLPRRL